jgi:hypothetical protein
MGRLIAVVTTVDIPTNYDDYDTVIKSITEWSEVTEKEYEVLRKWCNRQSYYLLLERVDLTPTGLTEILEKAAKEDAEEKTRRQKQIETAEKRANALKAKKEAKEKKLLEELSKKYQKE